MIKAAVVTVSDKGFRGERPDSSGPLLCQRLVEMGAQVKEHRLVPDEQGQIAAVLTELGEDRDIDLIVTTGGTGPSPRDATPEATRLVIEREMPDLAELFRWDGYRRTPFAVLAGGWQGSEAARSSSICPAVQRPLARAWRCCRPSCQRRSA